MEFKFATEESEPSREVGGFRFLDQATTPESGRKFQFDTQAGQRKFQFTADRLDPTPMAAYDELPWWGKVGVEALRAPTNYKIGALNTFGSITDSVLLALNEGGIVDNDTAEQWRKWGRQTNQFLAQGPVEGFVLNEAIKRIEGMPPGADLEQITAETNNFITGDLMQGLGSLTAFAITSRLLGPQFVRAGMSQAAAQYMGAGILGAVVQSNELYHDAVEHDATGWQKGVAWAAGAVTGPLEAVSIGRMLGRFDKAGAAAFTNLVTKRGVDPWKALSATQSASAAVKGMLEEGAQEFAQTWLGNLTAATIAGYDPERSYMENTWAAGGTGAATGFIGSAFLAAMGVRSGRIKALRSQEWQVGKDGRAKPPEESGWEAVEGGYSKGNLFIEPIDDVNGNTRWQLRNTKGEANVQMVNPEDLLEQHGKMPAGERDVIHAMENGDFVYVAPVMETDEADGKPAFTRIYSPTDPNYANHPDMDSILILSKDVVAEANKNVDTLGSWLKVETAANLGDRFLRQGHMGLDLRRNDFFGEFNAITEMHYALTKKRQDIIGRIKEEAIKLDRNAEWSAQFEQLAEQMSLYEDGTIQPLKLLLTGKETDAEEAQVRANIIGSRMTDTQFGILDANRAVAARQIITPNKFGTNRFGMQSFVPDTDRIFPGKGAKLGAAAPGFFQVLEAADAAARKDGSPLIIYSADKNGVDPFGEKKTLAYLENYVNNTLAPLVSKAISRANYKYATTHDADGKPWGKDKDGNDIVKMENPAVIIRLNFAEENANGFFSSMKEGHTFFVEVSAGEMLAKKRAVDAVEANIKSLLAAGAITQGEVKDTKRLHTTNKRKMLETATKRMTDTVAHELGHFITMRKVRELFLKYNNGTATDLEVATLKAMYQSYFEFLHARDTANGLRDIAYGDMLTTVGDIADGAFPGTTKEAIIHLMNVVEGEMVPSYNARWEPSIFYGQYRRGFEEFLANQVARVYANEPMTEREKAAAAPIRNAIRDLKKLASDLNEHFQDSQGARPYKGVKDVIDLMDIDSAIRTSGALENLTPKTVRDVINNKVQGFDPDVIAAFNEGMDSFSKSHDLLLNLVQIAKLNPHVEPLQVYLQLVQNWARRVGQTTGKADETLKLARKLKLDGKETGAHLGKVFFAEADKGEFLTTQEKLALTNGKWSAEMQQVYDAVKKNYAEILDRMRTVTLQDAQKNFATQPDKLAAVEAKINKDFDEMAAKPYFPFMRFGKWTITVKAGKEFVDTDGATYKPGQIVRFEAFDNRFDRARIMKQLTAKYGKEHVVGQGRMSDTRGSLQAMPISFLRALQSRLEQKLPADVREELNEIIQEYSPGESFRQAHMKRRKGTKGYSLDWQRSFAAYMRQAAGHIARMEFQPLMTEAIKDMESDVKMLNQTANGDKRSLMMDWMKTHEEYILNPSIEWAGLRGFMFQWFLGLNLKSAVVNGTQIPLVTYPYLGARYGDAAALKELLQANVDAVRYYRDPGKIPARPGSTQAETMNMLEELTDRQILEQSLATELALAASSQHLERYVVGPGIKRLWYKASEFGALPFHTVEKLNRVTSALAGYRLARMNGASHTEAVNAAHDTVLGTQYDYSKWNRPRFMRGRKGVVFLFQNYVQNTLFFGLGGDPGAMRHQMMMLLFAGLLGLPFMEDLTTLFNWGSTKVKRQLGMKDPYTDLRVEMREFASELVNNPDLFLHGIGSDSLGLGPLGRMAGLGAWTPQFDITASISMGRIIPGVDVLREQGGTFETGLVRGVERTGGAFASSAIQGMRAALSDDPNTWKRMEKAMPAFARNASRAARMATQGEEVTRGGDVIAEYDWRNPRDAMEIGLMGAGFQARQTSLGWQSYIHSRQPVLYYESWKRQIASQFNFAMSSGDREAIADMRKAVREYNSAVPFPEMSITGDYIRQSFDSYMQQQQKGRHGIPQSLNNLRLQRRVEGVFDQQTSPDN